MMMHTKITKDCVEKGLGWLKLYSENSKYKRLKKSSKK